MKMRVFHFAPDATGRTDFRIAYETFRARDPQKCIKEERAYLAALQRVLESASDPLGESADEAEALTVDLRFRKLKPEGATITVSQKVHEKLESFLEETPFQAGFAVAVEDFRDRWGQAEKKDDLNETTSSLGKVRRERA